MLEMTPTHSFHHSSTLCSIPLRLMTKSFVLFSKGTISRALARSLERCCFVGPVLTSPWLWLAFVLWRSVSMNSWRAASASSWNVLKWVFRYTWISENACLSRQSFSQKTQIYWSQFYWNSKGHLNLFSGTAWGKRVTDNQRKITNTMWA